MIRVWVAMIGLSLAFSGAAIALMRFYPNPGIVDIVIEALMAGALLTLSLFGLGLVALAVAGLFNSREEARREREQDV